MRDPKRISEALELINGTWNRPRDVKRIEEMLKHINEIWSQYPDMRFFQLLDHLVHEYKVYAEIEDLDLFALEDIEFIEFIEVYKKREGI